MKYLAGKVTRFHTNTTLQGQTLADHQWGTAVLMQYLFPNASKELILACLTHDVGEYRAGDLPYSFKNSPAGLEVSKQHALIEADLAKQDGWVQYALTADEQRQLSLCDRLEALLYSHTKYQSRIPAKWVDEEISIICAYNKDMQGDPTKIVNLINAIKQEFI
jgi:5'-deoxynucleotidase YfbR-like HD superfamily hydrolase